MKDRGFWKSRLCRYASSGVGALSLSLCALAGGESGEEVDNVVRVGLPALTGYGLDPTDARLALDRIFQLAWAETTPFKSEIYENDQEFYQAIRDGKIDLAPMLIEEYLNRPPWCEIDPVLQGVAGDPGGGIELILLAREEIDLKGLAGSKLLLDSAQQLTVPWLDLILAEENLPDYSKHFGIVGQREETADVVLQTFFGQADACVTSKQVFDSLAELNPNLRSRLKILAKSEPLAMHVICLASNFDAKRRDALLKCLRQLYQQPRGRRLLRLTKINRLDTCDTALVDAAASVKERWEVLREKRMKNWLKKQKEHAVARPSRSTKPERELPQ